MLFKKLANMAKGALNKYSGNTAFLNAVAASAALVAAADGSIEDEEISATLSLVKAHPGLAGAFSDRDIEVAVEKALKRAQTGLTGRVGLMDEIKKVSGDHEMAKTVFTTAYDIATADGSIDPKEQAQISKIAKNLNINEAEFI